MLTVKMKQVSLVMHPQYIVRPLAIQGSGCLYIPSTSLSNNSHTSKRVAYPSRYCHTSNPVTFLSSYCHSNSITPLSSYCHTKSVTPLSPYCPTSTSVTPLPPYCPTSTSVTPLSPNCHTSKPVTLLSPYCHTSKPVTQLSLYCPTSPSVTPLPRYHHPSAHARGLSTPLLQLCHPHTLPISLPHPRYAHFSVTQDSETKDPAGAEDKRFGEKKLDFGDAGWVFQHKSTRELLRGLLVLNACAIDPLVTHSYKLLTVGQKVLGSRLLGVLVRPFYNQFVAGDSEGELRVVSSSLAEVGVRLMVAPMLETDVGEGHDVDELYAWNLQKTVSLVEQTRRQSVLGGPRPICQTKITAHLTADVLARVSEAYKALDFPGRVAAVRNIGGLLKGCGGVGGVQLTPPPAPDHQALLHPLHLNPEDARDLINCLPRLHALGSVCEREDVVLAVDAEYTYTNPAINLLTLAMMQVFNREHRPPVVWNTYQGYLKEGVENLKEDLRVCEGLGDDVGFGVKIVRGAYLEKERAVAAQLGYPDPVNDTYEDTCDVYNRMVDLMLKKIHEGGNKKHQIIVASHNEESVVKASATLHRLGIEPQGGDVVFGQVYGMADNISIPLAASGLTVYKSVPCGSMSEVLPYLSRRAAENRAVLRGARRERQLLRRELTSRLRFWPFKSR